MNGNVIDEMHCCLSGLIDTEEPINLRIINHLQICVNESFVRYINIPNADNRREIKISLPNRIECLQSFHLAILFVEPFCV